MLVNDSRWVGSSKHARYVLRKEKLGQLVRQYTDEIKEQPSSFQILQIFKSPGIFTGFGLFFSANSSTTAKQSSGTKYE